MEPKRSALRRPPLVDPARIWACLTSDRVDRQTIHQARFYPHVLLPRPPRGRKAKDSEAMRPVTVSALLRALVTQKTVNTCSRRHRKHEKNTQKRAVCRTLPNGTHHHLLAQVILKARARFAIRPGRPTRRIPPHPEAQPVFPRGP